MFIATIKFNGERYCLPVGWSGCEVREKTKKGLLFLTGVFVITNSLNIGISFDLTDKDQKHMIYKQFAVRNCNGAWSRRWRTAHTIKH